MSPNRLIIAANIILLLPYTFLLCSLWSTGTKDAAASGLAIAGAFVFGFPVLRKLTPQPASHAWAGFSCFLLAVFLYVCAVAIDFRIVIGISAFALVAAQIYMTFGWVGLRCLAVPLLLLAMATPVPGFVLSEFTRVLLDLTVDIMPVLLEPFLGPIQVEGYHLFFKVGEEYRGLEIVEDCSGLGGILLFLPLSVIFLQAFGRVSLLAGSVVVLLSPILGYLGSVVRIQIAGLFMCTESDFLKSEGMHSFLGVLSLVLTGVVLLLICKLVGTKS